VPDLVSPSGLPQGAGGDFEAALSELTDQQRAVLFLRHVMGMSGHEVASILEINRAAVFATASRAERRLRRLLGDERPVQRSA
jgi:RNA polymerase sigma factor (sigma-70 family)